MATLIPSYSACLSRMTAGEKRLAQRLEAKLEEDYLCWYDAALGPGDVHADFVLLHPRHGLLILALTDWKLEQLQDLAPSNAPLFADAVAEPPPNPLEQARLVAQAVATTLERDAQLTFSSGKLQGRLRFPWSYGVVLANVTRRAYAEAGLDGAMAARQVICQDEMGEAVSAEAFQQRLGEMFHVGGFGHLSPPLIDRIRWHLFPALRVPTTHGEIPAAREPADAPAPETVRVLDLEQERLVRGLGEGHRVIHGVAGSGKTLILGYRAAQLARTCAKPILVLCHNKTLARRLEHDMHARGVAGKVHIGTFHAWCHRLLTTHQVGLPTGDASVPGYGEALVQRVNQALERHLIPAGQYEAVLIDEAHDFHPDWLRLAVRMVDPLTNSLLVLLDDAQSLHEDAGGRRDFSFKRLGIQARGRTTQLRRNYRNTQEILAFAADHAGPLLAARAAEEDGVPSLAPLSAGRHGEPPTLTRLSTLRDEASHLAQQLKAAHRAGTPWRDMAVLYRHWEPVGKTVNSMFRLAGIPLTWKDNLRFSDKQDTVKLLPFHASTGLEFPLVAIPGLGRDAGVAPPEAEARLLYVAMTRATERLLVTGALAG